MLHRRLGEFIWLDTFCIIQDSEDEKAVEFGRIPFLYNGDFCAIYAVSVKYATEGFLGSDQGHPTEVAALTVEAHHEGQPVIADVPRNFEEQDIWDRPYVASDSVCGLSGDLDLLFAKGIR